MWWEKNILAALLRIFKQMLTCAFLHFIFQAKVIGANITREITLGGAKYKATGRQLPTQRAAFIGKDGLYNDYAVMSLYDGAQLLIAMLLVISAGGLDVGPQMGKLCWWLLAVSLTICSWLLSPFIFNPYQFTCKGWKEDFENWKNFFFHKGGDMWKSWYSTERLCIHQPLRASSTEVLKRALFIGCLYTVANQKVHLLTVIFEGGQFQSIGMVIVPPIFATMIFIAALSVMGWFLRRQEHQDEAVHGIWTMEWRSGDANLMETVARAARTRTVRTRSGDVVSFAGHGEVPLTEGDFPLSFTEPEMPNPPCLKWAFEKVHYQADERIFTIPRPARPDDTAAWLENWLRAFEQHCKDKKLMEALTYEVWKKNGDVLLPGQTVTLEDFPLSFRRKKELHVWLSMVLVIVLVPVETGLLLWKFHLMGWHKSFVVGILLKFSFLCVVMELIECCLHIKGRCDKRRCCPCQECLYGLRSSIKTWLYGHRMAQDFFVSSLILLVLSIGTAFDGLRKACCGCEDCGLHNILIYRDPGGAHKRQENRVSQSLEGLMRGPVIPEPTTPQAPAAPAAPAELEMRHQAAAAAAAATV